MGLDASGYYSRSVRIGSKLRKIYLGKGPVAQLAAAQDELRRSERVAQTRAWEAMEAARAPAEKSLILLVELAETMAGATLLVAGYHRHDRGSWRRRRMHKTTTEYTVRDRSDIRVDEDAAEQGRAAARGDGQAKAEGMDPERQSLSESEIRELYSRAQRGDRTVLPALRQLLDDRPAVWQLCGDVALQSEGL